MRPHDLICSRCPQLEASSSCKIMVSSLGAPESRSSASTTCCHSTWRCSSFAAFSASGSSCATSGGCAGSGGACSRCRGRSRKAQEVSGSVKDWREGERCVRRGPPWGSQGPRRNRAASPTRPRCSDPPEMVGLEGLKASESPGFCWFSSRFRPYAAGTPAVPASSRGSGGEGSRLGRDMSSGLSGTQLLGM